MPDQKSPNSTPGSSTTTGSTLSTSPAPGITGTTGSTGTAGRDNLGEARSHLGNAATAAGDTLRGASRAARDELRSGSQGLRSELGEFANSSRAAAYDARDLADEKLQEAMDQGRVLMSSAERYVREKPLQAIGIAALAGFLIAKLR